MTKSMIEFDEYFANSLDLVAFEICPNNRELIEGNYPIDSHLFQP